MYPCCENLLQHLYITSNIFTTYILVVVNYHLTSSFFTWSLHNVIFFTICILVVIQARTQLLTRGGGGRGLGTGVFPRICFKIYMQDGGIWEPFQPYSDTGNCAHFMIFVFIRDHKCHCSQLRFIFLLSIKLFIRSIAIHIILDLQMMYVSINCVYDQKHPN